MTDNDGADKPFDAGLQGDVREDWPGIPFDSENDLLRDRSGRVTDSRPLVGLLYDLLRDNMQPSRLESLVRGQAGGHLFVFSNGWLARYAQDLAGRLLGVDDVETAFADACRSLKRVPTYEGWRRGAVADPAVHIHLRISMTRMADLVLFTATGRCNSTADDASLELPEIVLEKDEQEILACGGIAKFIESYIVDQAFVIAEAKWIARGDAD